MNQNTSEHPRVDPDNPKSIANRVGDQSVRGSGSTIHNFATFKVIEPDSNTVSRSVYQFDVDKDVKNIFISKLAEFTMLEVGDARKDLSEGTGINENDALISNPYYIVVEDNPSILQALSDILKKLEEITLEERKKGNV